MPRRVPVEREDDVALRDRVVSWLVWLQRKDRLIHDGEPTERQVELESLIGAVRRGEEVELSSQEIPGSTNPSGEGRFRLIGSRLVEF